jgi:N-acetylglucosaminyl-diphospho-decaprenol L-rhamnosyltransferase
MSLSISIISHKQAHLVLQFLRDLQEFSLDRKPEVFVTINIEEEIPFLEKDFGYKVRIIKNKHPQGFGFNHNQAFRLCSSNYFCIANPDVRLIQDPFSLLNCLAADPQIGVLAPLIMNGIHQTEDSARKLPTPIRLIKRVLASKRGNKLDYNPMNKTLFPDWLAGIFMIFPREVFKSINGFDERYFLYFEDVDLCCRLKMAGYKIFLEPSVTVIHEARRESHRRFRYLLWHILSGMRFFSSPVFWKVYFKRGMDQKD